MTRTVVSMVVVAEDPEHVTRAMEAFVRAATGLGLDGIDVALRITPDTEDPNEGGPDGD